MKNSINGFCSMYNLNIQHLTFIILLLFSAKGNAQSTVDNVLASIAKNNKSLKANEQFWEAKKLEYKTGNSLYNPSVEYDYLMGTPDEVGNQTEIEVVQAFDFPTSYVKKNQLANERINQAKYHLQSTRQDVLLEAKILCIELVYRNKLHQYLVTQKVSTEKLLSDFKTKLEKGDGNVLDVNKAQLQLLGVNKRYEDNVTAKAQLITKLTGLNGGSAIVFTDTIYLTAPNIASFEVIEQDYESKDPHRFILEHEKDIVQKQVELSKSLRLPKLEAGYRYVDGSMQTFNGFHTGISLPLWENKNTVKQQKARLLYSDLQLQDHLNEHYSEIKQLHERYENLKGTLKNYEDVFASLNSIALLDKSLSVGHISSLEYFMEINYYREAFNNYMQIEMEYHSLIAQLFKYKL